MSRDMLAALIDAAYTKRADDAAALPRRPDGNNPMRPIAQRPERRTRPTYADPTGNQAIGNIKKERKR